MRWIAAALLLGVFVAHDGANWLSEGTKYSPAAVFYMLQGAWTVMLSTVLLIFVWAMIPSLWRNLAIAALAISILEGSEVVGCRLAIADISLKPVGMNLCQYATGLPIGTVATCLEVFMIAWMIGSYLRR